VAILNVNHYEPFLYFEVKVYPLILVNGVKQRLVDVTDRGFQYGDGIFTTMPVHCGVPALFERHLDRLERDSERLGILFPGREVLRRDARQLLLEPIDGILKIQISRGQGGRGYLAPANVAPTRVLGLYPPSAYNSSLGIDGVAVRVCNTRLGRNACLAGIKHMNRLEQVLARSEWNAPDIHEGIVLDVEGLVTEGTMSNLFLVRGGEVFTPLLDGCGVAGIMRGLVLECARELNLKLHVTRIHVQELFTADEAFLTNSVIGLWPIRSIHEYPLAVGSVSGRVNLWLKDKIREESSAWHE
jgi:4-amino-4-deoxychorismate lyase